MKRVSHTLTYPATTVDAVFAMLSDPAYRKAVSDYQRVADFSCDIVPAADGAAGGGMTVRLEEAYGVDRIPSFAQKLVGNEIRFVQEESWASSSGARVHVAIPGKPGEMKGSTALSQAGDDVVHRVDLEVKVGVPLIGGKLEDLVADFMTSALDAEHKVGLKWLRGEWRR
jgi:hypothetical protein